MMRRQFSDVAKLRGLKRAAVFAWTASIALLTLSCCFEYAHYLRGFLMLALALSATATAAAVVCSFLIPLEKVYQAGVKAQGEGERLVSNGPPVQQFGSEPCRVVPLHAVRKLTRSDN